jgi:hypothetical protein
LINCGGTCIDPGTSQTHCGASDPCAQNPGTTCDPGEVCDGFGQCALSCQQGLTNCNGKCVDNLTDNANCGTCGNACPSGYLCSNGTCSLSCQQGLTQCTGKCVNVLTDNQNCGFCGVACGSGSVCSSGTCQLTCQPGLSICNNKCVDRLTDNAHCGTCNNVCPDGFLCTDGQCLLSCQEGLVECDNTCVDPLNDEDFCGADANCTDYDVCGDGEICNGNGVCAASCASPLEVCGDACTHTDYDPNNCGGCADAGGSVCLDRPNSTSLCNYGTCALVCDPGYFNCDGSDITGCEKPGALQLELCNGIDDDCNGTVDDGCPKGISTSLGSFLPYGQYGYTGGTAFSEACPLGQVIIGFRGWKLGNIDQMQPFCGQLNLSASATTPYTYAVNVSAGVYLTNRGWDWGSNFISYSIACPSNTVAFGLAARVSSDGISGLTLSCAPLVVTGSIGSFSLARGTPTTPVSVFANNPGTTYTDQAVAPLVFSQIRGRSGGRLEAIGMGDGAPYLIY